METDIFEPQSTRLPSAHIPISSPRIAPLASANARPTRRPLHAQDPSAATTRAVDAGLDRTTVLLIDKSPIMREGMRSILAASAQVEVIGEGASLQEALALCRSLHPQVTLLSTHLYDCAPLTAVTRMRRVYPNGAIIVVGDEDLSDFVVRLTAAGAAGYLPNVGHPRDIVEAVLRAGRGKPLQDATFLQGLVRDLVGANNDARPTTPSRRPRGPKDALTDREREVLVLLTRGLTNTGIAQVLHLSPGTVKIHVQNILRKLGVSDRTEAAVLATQRHLI